MAMGAEVELRRGARLLVRLPNWVGDVLFCTPSLAALRRARPDVRVTALVRPSVLPAVEGLPFVDEVLTLSATTPGRTLAEARRLRALGFHAALVFPKGFREALLVRLAGIPVRIGLATDRRRALLTRPVSFTREDWGRHHVDQFARVLSPLGISLAGEGMAFPVGATDREAASALLRACGVERPYAVLHAGASKLPRAWHPERFAEIPARHDLDLSHGRGLGGVRVGHEDASAAGRAREERDGERPPDRLQPPVERELPEHEGVRRHGARGLAARREDAQRDRQVERRPLLPHVGGSEIDRDPFLREREPVVLDRGGHPLAALAHRRGRQADDRERRQSAREIYLDRDPEPFDPENGTGTDFSDHPRPPRTSTPAAPAAVTKTASARVFSSPSGGA